jgi:hypothetical protein
VQEHAPGARQVLGEDRDSSPDVIPRWTVMPPKRLLRRSRIVVQRVPITRDLGEQLDVPRVDRPRPAWGLA